MTKTRILYITDMLVAGGVERLLTEMATRLDKTQFDVRVVCLYGEKAGLDTHFLSALQAANISVTVLNRGWSGLDKLQIVGDIIAVAQKFRPHLIHVLNYHSNFLVRFAYPFLPRPVQIVGTVWTVYLPKQLRYQQYTQGLITHFVVNSPHLEKMLVDGAAIPADKITFIPTSVDLRRFQQVPESSHRPDRAAHIKKLFLLPGRISPGKGQHLVAEAVGRLYEKNQWDHTNVVWLVGGTHKSGEQEKLTASIEKYGLQEIIRQFPRTEHIEQFYHVADVCLLPSLSEGMPNVAIEAMAAGKPLIITEGANAAGVIEHEKTGWVVPTNNIDALAEMLKYVVALPDETFDRLRDHCMQAAENYSVEVMIENYQELYQRLLFNNS